MGICGILNNVLKIAYVKQEISKSFYLLLVFSIGRAKKKIKENGKKYGKLWKNWKKEENRKKWKE